MSKILIITVSLLLSIAIESSYSQDHKRTCDSLLNESVKLRHNKEFDKAIEVLNVFVAQCKDSLNYYLELSINSLERADNSYNENGKVDKKERLKLFKAGLHYAKQASTYNIYHRHILEYQSLAFAGIISVSGLRDQAHLADSVRIYAEKMFELDNENDRALHILGRWHYEVASLPWYVRLFSKLIFGIAPKGDFSKSVSYFQRAVNLDDYIVHNYWLALAQIKNGDKKSGKKKLQYVLQLPERQHNDSYLKKQAQEVLQSL